MATSIGSYAHAVTLESALAAALTFRGAEVHALLCDGAMTACAECEASLYPDLGAFVEHGPSRDLCRDCLWPAERVYAQLGHHGPRYSDWLTPDDRAEARASRPTHAGRARSSASRSTAWRSASTRMPARCGSLRPARSTTSRTAEPMLRRYLESALLTAFATRRLLAAIGFSSAVFTHGIYVPWGIVGEVARQEGVHVSTWNVAYRKRRFIFSHDDTYHHTLMSEPREHWEDLELSAAQERELMQYLVEPPRGAVRLDRVPSPDDGTIPRTSPALIGLDPSKPVIGLLTNVSWDAQLHYPANAFPKHARLAGADVRVLRDAA